MAYSVLRLSVSVFLAPFLLIAFFATFLHEYVELLDQGLVETNKTSAITFQRLRVVERLYHRIRAILKVCFYFPSRIANRTVSATSSGRHIQNLCRPYLHALRIWISDLVQRITLAQLFHDLVQRQNSNIYSALGTDKPFIRILSIHPGSGTQRLECTLQAVAVDHAVFDAMSYTWLHHKCFRRRVLINGSWFLVNQNVYNALQSLRSVSEVQTIWIDQICINQGDLTEKSDQVQNRMAEVFKKAERVIVWLGPGSDAIADLFKTIRLCQVDAAAATARKYSKGQLATLEGLLEHNWWSRIWIVQEITLAQQRTAVIKCGNCEVLWRHFSNEIAFLMSSNQLYLLFSTDLLLRNARSAHRPWDLTNYLKVVVQLRNLNATDPRDKLYALIGLCGDDDPLIEVDYSMESAQVFAKFTICVIQRTGTLRILAGAELRQVKQCSWAMHWGSHVESTGDLGLFWTLGSLGAGDSGVGKYQDSSSEFCASGRFSARIEPDPVEWSALNIQGWRVSRIDRVGEIYYPWGGQSSMATLQSWENMARTYLGVNWESTFLDTVMAGTWAMHFKSVDWRQVCKRGLEAYDDLPPAWLNSASWEFYSVFSHCCSNRRLFLTEDGNLGLGPSSCRAGDMVCILLGSAVPSILRPATSPHRSRWRKPSNRHVNHARCFGYVGQTYVNGMMKNEHEVLLRDIESGVLILEDFHLCDSGDEYSVGVSGHISRC